MGLGIWSKVAIAVLGGIALTVGYLSWAERALVAASLAVALAYLSYRDHKGFEVEFVRGNLLYILPGQTLLLVGLATLKGYEPHLSWIWAGVTLTLLGFDAVAHASWSFRRRKRAIMALYVLAWGGIFFLIQQLISRGGRLGPGGVRTATLILTGIGVAYIGLALYRFTQLNPARE